MRIWTSLLLISLLTRCAIGKKEVRYAEMSSKPKVAWEGIDLMVKTENSKENSALLIYEIQSETDNTDLVILLHAFQAVGKEFKSDFKVEVKDIQIERLAEYKIYWLDPDGKRTQLEISPNK